MLLGLTKLDPSSKALFDRIARERAGEAGESDNMTRDDGSSSPSATREDADATTLPPTPEETPIPVEAEEGPLPDDREGTGTATMSPDGSKTPRDAALERLRARKRSN